MKHLAGTLVALVSLVAVLAVALGTMLAAAALMHHFFPFRHFNQFHALHEPIVLGLLLAASVLWVPPPHPWAQRSEEPALREPAASAGGAERGQAAGA